MRRAAAVVAGAVAAVAATVVAAPSASAATWNDQQSTTGARAVCTIVTSKTYVANDTAGFYCNITDTLRDDYAVYVSYWIDGYSRHRLSHNGGSGTVSRNGTTRGDASIGTAYWRVCRDRPALPDNCSPTVSRSP